MVALAIHLHENIADRMDGTDIRESRGPILVCCELSSPKAMSWPHRSYAFDFVMGTEVSKFRSEPARDASNAITAIRDVTNPTFGQAWVSQETCLRYSAEIAILMTVKRRRWLYVLKSWFR